MNASINMVNIPKNVQKIGVREHCKLCFIAIFRLNLEMKSIQRLMELCIIKGKDAGRVAQICRE